MPFPGELAGIDGDLSTAFEREGINYRSNGWLAIVLVRVVVLVLDSGEFDDEDADEDEKEK